MKRLYLIVGWSLMVIGFLVGTWWGLDALRVAYQEYAAGHIVKAGVQSFVYAGLYTTLGMAPFMISGAVLLSFVYKLPPPKPDPNIQLPTHPEPPNS